MKRRSENSKALRVLKGGVVLAVAGIGAGCSSDVTRFDSFYTSSIPATPPANVESSNAVYPSVPVGPKAQTSDPYNSTASQQAVRPVEISPSSSVSRAPLGAPERNEGTVAAPVREASIASPQTRADRLAEGMRPRSAEPGHSAVIASNSGSQKGWNGAGSTVVTVRSGDTLSSIARQYGVSMAALANANGISDPSRIRIGQQLTIPASGGSLAAGQRKLASLQHSGSLSDQVPNRNRAPSEPHKSTAIEPRTTQIRKPSSGQAAAGNAAAQGGMSSENGTYKVSAGDSLWGIAHSHGVSVDELRRANGIEGTSPIQVGQTLRIPAAGEVQVAKAEPAAAPRATGNVAANQEAATSTKLPSYTPPERADQAIEQTDKQIVASTPDATGVGKMRWPARGRIISNYGEALGASANDGIDISVPRGTPIKAAENGIVIYAGDGLKRFGNTVLVRHENGIVTVYGNASELKVTRGERVRRGQEIALSGMSGAAETPRVHFEVRKNSEPVNPIEYLE